MGFKGGDDGEARKWATAGADKGAALAGFIGTSNRGPGNAAADWLGVIGLARSLSYA